ncbi:uncharacterized protein METZ01_LOCUS512972 [marine metagenome]|uniref:Uncharacterized protein n=1 Tax=marine metagenome TaxID=408172 RepID=A0A383EVK8_9ZZZZ
MIYRGIELYLVLIRDSYHNDFYRSLIILRIKDIILNKRINKINN